MKRVLLSLPMLGVVVLLITDGLYTILSDYYPEKTRPFVLFPVAWGISLAFLLVLVWVRPSPKLVRVMAFVAMLPISFILLGHIWSGVRYGREIVAGGFSLSLAMFGLLVIACLCVRQFTNRSSQANFSSKPTADAAA